MTDNSVTPKQVLVRMHPKHVKLMASGDKSLEIRKSFPEKIDTPFTVVVYCTKMFGGEILIDGKQINGYVVGEFKCRECEKFRVPHENEAETMNEDILKRCGSTYEALHSYFGNRTLCAWDVYNFKMYDEPRKLEEYGIHTVPKSWTYLYQTWEELNE